MPNRRDDGSLYPIHDPTSEEYPDRIFYSGRWKTDEQMKKLRADKSRYNAHSNSCKINAGRIYLGYLGMIDIPRTKEDDNGTAD